MAREWALAGVNEEELKPSAPLEPPKTPQGKWENFWYHHKWKVWLGTFIAVVVGVCLWQVFTRNEPDYRLALVTKTYVTDMAADLLAAQLVPYGEDLDGDGTVEVLVEPIYLENRGNNAANVNANSQKFTAYLASGDVMFFAMDPSFYEERLVPLLSEDFAFFAPLNSALATEEEGRLWNWNGSKLQQNEVIKAAFPENLVWGVRLADGTASGKDSRETHEQSMALLQKLLAAMAE